MPLDSFENADFSRALCSLNAPPIFHLPEKRIYVVDISSPTSRRPNEVRSFLSSSVDIVSQDKQ